ncbi:MAG TPA: hypothetical protein ENK57_11720 [Polyangiaceae bacterium]|nr:hypothetical protein [Polyangiaceae bacterium]
MRAQPRRTPRWPGHCLAAVLVMVAGCSEPEPSATGGGGASVGGGGTGGDLGTGGADDDQGPTIESLTTDMFKITALPTTIVVSALVTDPQGDDDIASGSLSSEVPLGTFVPTGAPGGYQVELVIDESLGWAPQGYHVLLATFVDQAGNVAERSTGLELDLTGCSVAGSYDACRDCFCMTDPAGCASYVGFEYEHLYCGATCSGACDAFCQSLPNPDPLLIDTDCAACEPSNDDLASFEQACLGVIPECFGFLVDLGQCPQP